MEEQNVLEDTTVPQFFLTKRNIPFFVWIIIAIAAIAVALFFIVTEREVSQKQSARASKNERDSLLQRVVRQEYSEGREEGERLLKKYPADPFILKNAAVLYYNSGVNPRNHILLTRAEELLERYYVRMPSDFISLRMLAQIKNELMRRRESIVLLEKAVQQFPERASELYFDLGTLYDLNGSKREARRYFEFVLKNDPNHVPAHTLLSRLAVGTLKTATDIPTMRNHALKAIELSKNSLQRKNRAFAYTLLAESYLFEEKFEEGLVQVKRGIALNPVCAACVHVLGEILVGKYHHERTLGRKGNGGELVEGTHALEESLELNPLLSHAYVNLGLAYWFKGEFIRARATWEKGLSILSKDPYYPNWYKPVIKKELEEALASHSKTFSR